MNERELLAQQLERCPGGRVALGWSGAQRLHAIRHTGHGHQRSDRSPWEPIIVALATANRDRDVFDLSAPPASQLAFGAGPHFCLGAPLARLEGEIALRELFGRFPGLRMAVPETELTTPISPVINGLTALPVVVG